MVWISGTSILAWLSWMHGVTVCMTSISMVGGKTTGFAQLGIVVFDAWGAREIIGCGVGVVD